MEELYMSEDKKVFISEDEKVLVKAYNKSVDDFIRTLEFYKLDENSELDVRLLQGLIQDLDDLTFVKEKKEIKKNLIALYNTFTFNLENEVRILMGL